MGGGESDREAHQVPATAEGMEDHTAFKTRSRRVSFAETTAIHFFKRDEDYETPPDSSTPGSGSAGLASCAGQSGDDDNSEGNGTEEEEEHELFVKNVVDSSPGSGFGSATSNDDYNLFGPVSTSFIRSDRAERLSETSEDNNHDITLDSMTFSMHFRNVLPCDDLSVNSVRSLNTPTGVSTPTDPGNFASFTGARKKTSGVIPGGGMNSDSDMSFVTQNINEYDYEKLPPRLEALLMNVDESMYMASSLRSDIKVASSSMDIVSPESGGEVASLSVVEGSPRSGNMLGVSGVDKASLRSGKKVASFSMAEVSPKRGNMVASSNMDKASPKSGSEVASPSMDTVFPKSVNEVESCVPSMNLCLEQHDLRNKEPHRIHDSIEATNMVDNNYVKPGAWSDSLSGNAFQSNTLPNCQTTPKASTSAESPVTVLGNDEASGNPYKLHSSPLLASDFTALTVAGEQKQRSLPVDSEPQTPYSNLNPDQQLQSPFEGSIASLSDKRRNLFCDPSVSSKSQLVSTPFGRRSAYSSKMDVEKHGERISAIKDSISKFKNKSVKDGFKSESPSLHRKHLRISAIKDSISKLKNKSVKDGFKSESPSLHRKHLQSEFEAAFNSKTGFSTSTDDGFSISTTNGISFDDQLVSAEGRVQIPTQQTHQLIDNDGLIPVHLSHSIPRSTRDSCCSHESHQDPDALCEPFTVPDDEIIGKRRSSEELPLMNENERAKKNRKVIPEIKDRTCVFSPVPPTVSSEVCNAGIEASAKDWKEIFSKVSEIAEKPLPLPVNTISLAEIDVVEDKLIELQRASKFERLYIDMQSMMKKNQLDYGLQKRAAEVKLLQDMIVYEKAKLQLVKAKRDGLLEKTQCLQSGIEECHKLRCALAKSYHPCIGKNKLMKEDSLQDTSTRSSITSEEEQNKVSSMRQELKGLEEKLKGLRDIFETSCKIKENTSFDEMIKIVNDQLKQRNHCRLILKDLLVWEIVDVQNENDQCRILLSYQNLLDQRFTVKAVPGSGLSFRNSVNVANIEKRFPNMRACTAFNFIFTTEDNCRMDDLKCFRQETQTTSFIFGNLLDLLGEVQTAQLKIGNLMSSSFYSPRSHQLELELTFLNFKSGRKVILSLDMSNLKSGIYPSEPSELQILVTGGKNVLPSSVSDVITCAIRGLNAGYSVIANICQCISCIV